MPKVSIITPARNEEKNIGKLIDRIKNAGIKEDYEIVVVDDSDNNATATIALAMGARVIEGRHKGLAQAVVDGIADSDGEYIINLDSDCQHPPELLPKVIEGLDQHDLVVVTKHSKEANDELSLWRKLQSNLAVFSAHMLVPAPVSDPMAGFFGVRRECLEGVELNAIGFKIGLEIFAKAKWVTHCEIPMAFAKREDGESKGTAHSLHKHLWKLFQETLSTEIVLPKGSEEYYAFYEGGDGQKKWKRSIAELLKEITQEIKPNRLLDAGCGSSPNINFVSARKKIGIDINEKALEYMRSHSDAKFVSGSVTKIPFATNSFDCILCIEVLEHLYPDDVNKAISEISRVLVSGGYAIIATPNYASLSWNLLEKTQKLLQPKEWTSDHHTQLNQRLLSEMCLNQGLEEIKYDSVMRNMDMVITYQKI